MELLRSLPTLRLRSAEGMEDGGGSSKRRSLSQSSGPGLHPPGTEALLATPSNTSDSRAWTPAGTGGASGAANEELGRSAPNRDSMDDGSGKGDAAEDEEDGPPLQARAPATPSSRMPHSTPAFPMRDGQCMG